MELLQRYRLLNLLFNHALCILSIIRSIIQRISFKFSLYYFRLFLSHFGSDIPFVPRLVLAEKLKASHQEFFVKIKTRLSYKEDVIIYQISCSKGITIKTHKY